MKTLLLKFARSKISRSVFEWVLVGGLTACFTYVPYLISMREGSFTQAASVAVCVWFAFGFASHSIYRLLGLGRCYSWWMSLMVIGSGIVGFVALLSQCLGFLAEREERMSADRVQCRRSSVSV